jgi:phthalate 4,5-cis-dihydrodiol dehydrogenase
MKPRSTAPGAFTALLEFEDGAFATLIYNGYGYFSASELFDTDRAGPGASGLEGRLNARREIFGGQRDDAAIKDQINATRGTGAPTPRPGGEGEQRGGGLLGDLGVLVVSCEHGDIRQSPGGVYVYSDEGTTEVPLSESRSQARPELEELYDELTTGKPALHSGRWGLATMEVSMAIMQSAQEHRDIKMEHQVSVPDWA